jgi:hypothetical protein
VLIFLAFLRSPLFLALPVGLSIGSRLLFSAPCFQSFFDDHRVIQSAVPVKHKTVQRFVADPAKLRGIASGQSGYGTVVIRQTAGRPLVPRCTPQKHGGAEPLCAGSKGKVAVTQPHRVERHEAEIPQVDVGADRGLWEISAQAAAPPWNRSRLLSSIGR